MLHVLPMPCETCSPHPDITKQIMSTSCELHASKCFWWHDSKCSMPPNIFNQIMITSCELHVPRVFDVNASWLNHIDYDNIIWSMCSMCFWCHGSRSFRHPATIKHNYKSYELHAPCVFDVIERCLRILTQSTIMITPCDLRAPCLTDGWHGNKCYMRPGLINRIMITPCELHPFVFDVVWASVPCILTQSNWSWQPHVSYLLYVSPMVCERRLHALDIINWIMITSCELFAPCVLMACE